MSKHQFIGEISLETNDDWVNQELDFFQGNLVGNKIQLSSDRLLYVISAYSPAWQISKEKYQGLDLSHIMLKDNSDIWAAQILLAGLKETMNNGELWIVGGDLNTSETFDIAWQIKNNVRFGIRSYGNKEILDRFTELGLTECLRYFNDDQIIPTFKHSRGKIDHQLDHLFVSDTLYTHLKKCYIGDANLVFDNYSDHLPIIADF